MPLLIETHVHKMVGMVVVVSCSPTVQVSTKHGSGMKTAWHGTAQHGDVCASDQGSTFVVCSILLCSLHHW